MTLCKELWTRIRRKSNSGLASNTDPPGAPRRSSFLPRTQTPHLEMKRLEKPSQDPFLSMHGHPNKQE